MKKILGFAAAVLLLAVLTPVSPARAAGPLDEIKSYSITVDPRSDGTLDLKYHIDWLVLDSTSEGPLTWVRIGIPNSHADSLKALSGTVKKISYLSDSGSYVRLDLDRAYTAGETVPLDFSIHQSYMYRLDSEDKTCSFTFVPGWFDDIRVDSLKILWNKANVAYSDATGAEGDYLTWSTALEPGKRLTAIVRYDGGVFATSESMQEQQGSIQVSTGSGDGAAVISIVVIVVIVVIAAVAGGGGRYRGGFWGGGFHGGGHGGGGCACACASCACACACAGGGRAGCSAKNFYGAAVDTDKLKARLTKKRI
ncbi:hypothetical protein SAMN02745823_02563 [Sporobacter termitidis DSM 10068]|uniref:DUF2207 domain-containing protein n=1 Tax=Sporobacter termitidis DSM 10068 TaxID=1123282 RepID=A0A1M5YJU6_9FIRM|nr:hypothetical protein [Sporobacter termitidis]SHI12301.1 hypothetical protein SAMN02745823_02563 [Sporobacter termitidis DSM 10068]